MTGSQLRKWRHRMKLKAADASKLFGVSPDTWARWEAKATLPRMVGLACAALSFGLPPAEG